MQFQKMNISYKVNFIIFIMLKSTLVFGMKDDIFSAVSSGDFSFVKNYFIQNIENINVKNNKGYILLHLASKNKHASIVEFLLSKGACC